jgi:hypothetical protein
LRLNAPDHVTVHPAVVAVADALQAFSCYMHVLVVRLFVETVLRYGLPPAFQAAVVKPADKSEAKLRSELAVAFSDGACTPGRSCCLGGVVMRRARST